jgi:hypothetical protein
MKQTSHQTKICEKHYGKKLCGFVRIDGDYIPATFHPAIGWYFMDSELFFHFIDEPPRNKYMDKQIVIDLIKAKAEMETASKFYLDAQERLSKAQHAGFSALYHLRANQALFEIDGTAWILTREDIYPIEKF